MRRFLLPTCLAAAMIVGCKSTSSNAPYPNDPLLISKKPIEGKPGNTSPIAVVHREPAVPLPPSEALANASPKDLPAGERRVDVLANNMNKE